MNRLACGSRFQRSALTSLVLAASVAASASPAAGGQPWGIDDGGQQNRGVKAGGEELPPGLGVVGFPQYPSLSPDGRLVVFAWAGDLWVVPISGGISTRLTAHAAEERRSAFSPDGRFLAFESNREGARNLYVMALATAGDRVTGGAGVRVTNSDQSQGLGSFTSDGRGLLFASTRDPAIYRASGMYRVDLRGDESGSVVGGGAVSRITEAFGAAPRMSGDGRTVVFVRNNAGLERPKYRGSGNTDVYAFEPATGAFRALTSEMGTDADPWPLPDGSVVFISSRDGQNNVWRLSAAGEAVQLTRFAPTAEQVTIGHGVRDLAVSADGKTAVFAVWDALYRLDLTDRNAQPRVIPVRAAGDAAVLDFQRLNLEREVSEQAISPDGKTLAVVARGEIFVRSTQEGFPTRRVTDTPGRERDLAWSPDGRVLYFASDDAGAARSGDAPQGVYGLYAASVDLSREDIQTEKPKPVADRPPEPKKDEPAAAPVPAPTPAPPATPPPAPGAEKAVAAPPTDPAPAPAEAPPAEAKSAKPAEKKESRPDHGKRWAESLRFRIDTVVAPGTEDVRSPIPSPDGKKLLYSRHRGDLVLREIEGGAERVLVNAWEDTDAVWAADSRHIIYSLSDLDFNSDLWLMDTASPPGPAETGENGAGDRGWPNPVNLTRHPDEDRSPRLSADGKVLTFLSERAGENGEFDVFQISLDSSLDAMTGYERDEYFKRAAEAAAKRKPLGAAEKDAKGAGDKGEKKDGADKAEGEKEKKDADKPASERKDEPLKFDASDAYRRVRRLTSLAGPESSLAVTPGADRVLFVASLDGDRSLVSVDHKGGDRKVLQAGGASNVAVSLTGDRVSFIRQGQVYTTTKTGGKVDALPIDAPVVIDVAKQQRQKFLEAAKALGVNFYHPTLKGLDWAALTRRYLSLAERTRTNEEFNRVTQMLFGELEGSHTGISGAASFTAPPPATGYLGAFTRPVPSGFEVLRAVADTPAAAKTVDLKPGDVIVGVDGQRLAEGEGAMPGVDLDAAMAGRAGKETLIEVRRAKPVEGQANPQLILVVPMSYSAFDNAQYWDEVARRQAMVEQLSGGRLGYLHIRAMGAAAVLDFERDLFAAAGGKDGLVIDVRDNGGGFTADILLSSLTAPRHAYTAPRGADMATLPKDAYPRDRRLIYGYTRPINVLINQNSFSNAEIFAHAIKTIGRGRLVGTPTFGGVISTGATGLIDGTMVRLPFRGWYLPDGTDMENNGARPDVDVPQRPEDEAAGRDPQLEAAVQELLGRLNGK